MSKEIVRVESSASREMHQTASGSFSSTHKPEDIEKWLKQTCADEETSRFDEVFGTENDWWEEDYSNYIEDFEVSFTEEEGEDECEYDEEIQEFIDEEPKRERDAGMNRVAYQLKDLIGNIDGIKDTTIQLLNDFKKVVKTDDVENLPEEEKKLYQTLNDMTQLSLKFPKPEVKKETYDPF